jgi:aldose 1-epimerase
VNPSGEQVELTFGEQRAVVVGVGAGLRTYTVGDRTILDGYGVGDVCPSGRGQLLAPWPNRIEDGSYEFDGRSFQLPLNEPARRNAIHGLVRWSHWSVAERAADRVAFEHVLYPQPGYPFALEPRAEYSLSEVGLEARIQATNVGSEAAPFGAGWHPYLAVEGDVVDEVELCVPAETVLVADERGLPVGAPPSPTRAWTSARPGRSGPRGSTTASPASSATAAAGPLRVSAGRRSGSTRPSAT